MKGAFRIAGFLADDEDALAVSKALERWQEQLPAVPQIFEGVGGYNGKDHDFRGMPVAQTIPLPSGALLRVVRKTPREVGLSIDGVRRHSADDSSSRGVAQADARVAAEVPDWPHFLLRLFVPQRDRDALIGDLVEEFHEDIVPSFGLRRARFWFWKQTFTSLFPIARARLVNLATFGWIAEWLRQTLR